MLDEQRHATRQIRSKIAPHPYLLTVLPKSGVVGNSGKAADQQPTQVEGVRITYARGSSRGG
jgi:hypothetical protein